MEGKRFVDTAAAVALNDILMTHVWKTHETPKQYSGFREVSVLAFKQTSRSATCTCLQPLRYSQVLEGFVDEHLCIHRVSLFLDVYFTMEIQPAKFTEIFCRVSITHQETEIPIRYDIEYFSTGFFRTFLSLILGPCICHVHLNIKRTEQKLTSSDITCNGYCMFSKKELLS